MSLFEELAVKMGHVASTCEKRKTLISANGLNMMGYISGINRQKHGKKDYSNGIAPNALVQWIENYSKQNPLNPFSYAVDAMLEEIGSRK